MDSHLEFLDELVDEVSLALVDEFGLALDDLSLAFQ